MHLKLLNDTQNSHTTNQSCFLKGKNYKMLQSKKPIKQRSSCRKSAPLTSVTKPSHSFPDLSLLKFLEHERTNNTFTKSHSIKMRLFYASRIIVQNYELRDDNRQNTVKRSFSDAKNLFLRPQTRRYTI